MKSRRCRKARKSICVNKKQNSKVHEQEAQPAQINPHEAPLEAVHLTLLITHLSALSTASFSSDKMLYYSLLKLEKTK